MNLSFRQKRSGRPEPSNHLFLLHLLTFSHREYWFPVLPRVRQTGTTNRGKNSVSRFGGARNYFVFSETLFRQYFVNRTAVSPATCRARIPAIRRYPQKDRSTDSVRRHLAEQLQSFCPSSDRAGQPSGRNSWRHRTRYLRGCPRSTPATVLFP